MNIQTRMSLGILCGFLLLPITSSTQNDDGPAVAKVTFCLSFEELCDTLTLDNAKATHVKSYRVNAKGRTQSVPVNKAKHAVLSAAALARSLDDKKEQTKAHSCTTMSYLKVNEREYLFCSFGLSPKQEKLFRNVVNSLG